MTRGLDASRVTIRYQRHPARVVSSYAAGRSDGIASTRRSPCRIIAHRGASADAPESTRAAIRAAVRGGAHMIELDVQMTRDGRLVIFHDDRLNRTTNGRGRLVKATYAQVARLDAGSWFHPRFAGERVLLLSEALRVIPHRVRINLELKRTRHGRRLVQRVLRTVRRARAQTRVVLSSFDAALLDLAGRCGIPRALIGDRQPERSLQRAIRAGYDGWHPKWSLVTPARIAHAHAAGVWVYAWTVDTVGRARRLRRWGVDGIFTNDPATFRSVA